MKDRQWGKKERAALAAIGILNDKPLAAFTRVVDKTALAALVANVLLNEAQVDSYAEMVAKGYTTEQLVQAIAGDQYDAFGPDALAELLRCTQGVLSPGIGGKVQAGLDTWLVSAKVERILTGDSGEKYTRKEKVYVVSAAREVVQLSVTQSNDRIKNVYGGQVKTQSGMVHRLPEMTAPVLAGLVFDAELANGLVTETRAAVLAGKSEEQIAEVDAEVGRLLDALRTAATAVKAVAAA